MLRDDWYNLHKNDNPGDDSAPDFKKKWNNWWYYNKWYVLVAALVGVLMIDFAHSVWQNKNNQPDLQIAYVGQTLPMSTVDALEQAMVQITPDLNGDGQVLVSINEYDLVGTVYGGMDEDHPAPADPATAVAAQTRLAVDLQNGDSMLFLMADPEAFQQSTGALCRIDGTLPEETPDSDLPLYLGWSDCPVLDGLDLGLLADPMLSDTVKITNQTLLSELSIGRRFFYHKDQPELDEAFNAFWESLIAGAEN